MSVGAKSGAVGAPASAKIFGSGSRAPIAISLLVKNPVAAEHGRILFHDIGDYLTREDKLEKIETYASINGITQANAWQPITPDAHGDWLNQRDDSFSQYIVLGDKKGDGLKLFENFSQGVLTSRDAWCYNASRDSLASNMTGMIEFYNEEQDRFQQVHGAKDKKQRDVAVDGFINTDSTKISWSGNLKNELSSLRPHLFENQSLIQSLYRPYAKNWLYYNRRFNERVYQMPRIFPDAAAENRVICVTGIGSKACSVLMTDTLPSYDNIEKGQCFPLYLYDEAERDGASSADTGDLFKQSKPAKPGRQRRDAITEEGLEHFQDAYPGEKIGREDIFYYIYGLLHSPDYRQRFADNLRRELPRIPCVKKAADFWAFSRAGRELAHWHLNYETVDPYPAKVEGDTGRLKPEDYRVEKMKYGGKGKEKDLTTLHYNAHITVRGIPLEAYEYVVNGKPALDWVVERQCVKTDKASGIVNDANAWATETMNNPRYPLELFLRVITVSMETMKIVKALPRLDI